MDKWLNKAALFYQMNESYLREKLLKKNQKETKQVNKIRSFVFDFKINSNSIQKPRQALDPIKRIIINFNKICMVTK